MFVGEVMSQLNAQEKRPLLTFFLSAYPFNLYPEVDLPHSQSDGAEPDPRTLFAALSRTPPTSTMTPGKTRPGGYNSNGKYLPSKYIPAKMDKRAGK